MSRRTAMSREAALSEAKAPEFVLDRHLFFWLTQVLERRDRQLSTALKAVGVRVPEWRVLGSLHARQQLTMSELADLTNIERTTLSRTSERMVRAGWVSRLTDSGDGRITRLTLTETGERLFQRAWPAVHAVNDAAIAGVPAPAIEMTRWALQQMCRNFDVLARSDERAGA